MVKFGLANIGIGVVFASIGIGVTIFTYMAATPGGTYIVAWGAIAVGVWRILLGLYQLLPGLFGVQAEVPVSSPGPRRTLPLPMLIIGAAFILQALVRAGFLVNLLSRVTSQYFENPQFLILSVTVPALLAAAGIIAGILTLRQAPEAHRFCVTFCKVGLIWSLYGLGMTAYYAATLPSFHATWLTWTVVPVYIAVYLGGLIVFARARGAPAGLRTQAV
jgi:hypothetical protein